MFVTGDVSKEDDVQNLVKKTVDALGGLDIVSFTSLDKLKARLIRLIDGGQCRNSQSSFYPRKWDFKRISDQLLKFALTSYG